MKLKLAAAMFAVMATPALAWEGQVVECYGKVWNPAQYSVKEILVKPAKTEYEHRNGQLAKVYYPPVYREHKTLTHQAHWIMRKEPCK